MRLFNIEDMQMPKKREVGTLWIGGELSWMEQVCLKSFADKGQRITLFSYEDIPNVPDGVIHRDARDVVDTDDFIKYRRRNSYALFADWFRLKMIHQNPGMIWVDTDVYCHRPMEYDSDYVMGYQMPGSDSINNAVLGLPSQSRLLKTLLDFMDDRYSIAPFLPEELQQKYRDSAEAGNPVHVSEQPWGIWGPLMLSYYVRKLGLSGKVMPQAAFYPISYKGRRAFLRYSEMSKRHFDETTTAVHLWATNKIQIGQSHHGLPPSGSFLDEIVKTHGVDPALAPVKSRDGSVFDAGLIDEIDLDKVKTVADVSGNARSLSLALARKVDCEIWLMNHDRKDDQVEDAVPCVKEYTSFLVENGVSPDRIKVARSTSEIPTVDVLWNLNGFGDKWCISGLEPYLKNCMHPETRLFTDMKRNFGAFKYLNRRGTVTQLAKNKDTVRSVFSLNCGDVRTSDASVTMTA